MSKSKTKILIIEDNPGDLRLINEALQAKNLDFEIEHCETADSAVQKVKRYQSGDGRVPDVILIDYNLPGGTAREVLRAVNDNAALSRVKKAVLTCSAAPQDRVEALKAGAHKFLYKPADFDSFVNDVGNAVVELLSSSEAL